MAETADAAADAADPRPEPPFEVTDDMCCGSGCEPCILDIYQTELREYRRALAEWEARHKQDGQTP